MGRCSNPFILVRRTISCVLAADVCESAAQYGPRSRVRHVCSSVCSLLATSSLVVSERITHARAHAGVRKWMSYSDDRDPRASLTTPRQMAHLLTSSDRVITPFIKSVSAYVDRLVCELCVADLDTTKGTRRCLPFGASLDAVERTIPWWHWE